MKQFVITVKATALLIIVLFSVNLLWASPDIAAQLRLYEGFKVDAPAPAGVITSYYLKPIPPKNMIPAADVEKEQASLKKVFNLKDIKMITEANMILEEKSGESPFEVIVLDGRRMHLKLSTVKGEADHFKVEVVENGENTRPLLETKFLMPEKKATVLGFEDSKGKTYFISFYRDRDLAAERSGDIASKAVNIKDIEKPKLVKSPPPEYPKEALKAGIEGKVIIEAISDENGKVVSTKVVEGPPELRTAALNAIKQWQYEPYILNKKPTPVKFTVVIKFNPNKKGKEGKPVQVSAVERPKLIKKVIPVYPQAAIDARLEGNVVIEAVTDTNGHVVKAEVLDGPDALREPALAAIKQWEYEPYVVDGVVKGVSFTVIMNFALDKKKKREKSLKPVMLSADQRPKAIKRTNPRCPDEARNAKVQGIVVLEVTIDTKGKVTEAKIIDGPELLRSAALAAIKEWQYEPYYLDGKPHPAAFTETIKFRLQ